MYKETACQKLEDYIIEMGENSSEFQQIYMSVVSEEKETNESTFLLLLQNMWIECLALREISKFLRLSFADPISRAPLSDSKDKNAKFARSIIPIDLMEAVGLKKSTDGKVCSIEDLVYMFVERETYKFQQMKQGVHKLDLQVQEAIINGNPEGVA